MSRQDGLSEWTATVSTNMPHLTKPQARLLALWSYGIALTRWCGRGTVATFLALLLEPQGRQRRAALVRMVSRRCPTKPGPSAQALDVTTCFVPLLRWIVRLWHGTQLGADPRCHQL